MCQVSLPQQEQVLYNFCLCSCINNSCMEEESVGVTYNKTGVERRQTLGPLRSIIPTWSTTSSNNHLSFSLSHKHAVCTWIYKDFVFVSSPMSTMKGLPKRCQSLVGLVVTGCWYTWFGRLSNIAHRYRKSISIIETYSIDNKDFLAP